MFCLVCGAYLFCTLLTFIEAHELVDVLLAHSSPLPDRDSRGSCDRLQTIRGKSAPRVVHDAAVVIVANQGGAGRVLLCKVVLCSRPDICPVDSDICVPIYQILHISSNLMLKITVAPSHLSGLDCSCHVPSACNISCSIVPDPVQPFARLSSCLPKVLPT